MGKNQLLPKSRLEAFSDGVIAIIITIMVFELKVSPLFSRETLQKEFWILLPKFISYAVSFTMLAVLWVNHHHLFHHIRSTDNRLTWLNMKLLFWMSLIPFGTGFIGANHRLDVASCLYGAIFFMTALSFKLLREYAENQGLMQDPVHPELLRKSRFKSKLTLLIYALATVSGLVSPWLSFVFIITVPVMYIVPSASTGTDGR
jgi:uncharacterized membrane protein